VALASGCSHVVTNEITSRMIPEQIYNDYQVAPANLAPGSKCAGPPTVKIVNADARNQDVETFSLGAHRFLVNPRTVMDSTSSYLKYGFEKSGIKVDDGSSKVLELKLAGMERLPGMWQIGGKVRIELNSPDGKLSQVYEGQEYGQYLYTLFADAIHLVSRQIVDNQAVQDYLLCK
jgi:hypothetical protein